MNAGLSGYEQTTKGIWAAVCPEEKLIVLDIEGCDSFERGEDLHFQNVIGALTMIFSDVLMIHASHENI